MRLRRATGSDIVQERENDVSAAKSAMRTAERELSAVHAQLFGHLSAFPELARRIPEGVPSELLPLLKTGRHIEHYTAREKLPTLSRQTVWKAELDGRAVALKEYRVDPAALKTCFREAALLHKCQHPAVAVLEAVFESEGFFYLQMPFYANGTLQNLSDRTSLSARYLLELLLPLSQAVAHLDALGVLHSDIKPDNILIDADMRPRLSDFDISVDAATRRSRAFATSTASVAGVGSGVGGGGGGGGGTIGFLAPEVLSGGVVQLTCKSDIFSLGKSFEDIAAAPPGRSGGASSSSSAAGSSSSTATTDDSEPLRRLLARMTAVDPKDRPTPAEVTGLAQKALAELVQLEADQALRAREQEAQRMQGEIARLEAANQSAEAERATLQRLQALRGPPAYWTNVGGGASNANSASRASSDGLALVGLDQDSETWRALAALLDTDGSQLGTGADHKHKSAPYDRLQLASAWRIENHPLWGKYAGGRHTVEAGLQRVLSAGKPRRDVNCRLHDTAARLPGGLSAEANEEILLHGTTPSQILSILSTGLNEHFSGTSAGTAFGDGVYFAEDAGKTDHYVTMDRVHSSSAATRGSNQELHQRLYADAASHPGRVFYLLVCRVAAGYVVRTTTAHNARMTSPDTGEPIFPVLRGAPVTRELAPVSGVQPPVAHNTLIAEDHSRGGPYRYREYIVFQNANIFPEYLIAYQRFNGSLGPLA